MTNKMLFLMLLVVGVVVVLFIDKMQFHIKTPDPRLWIGIEAVELTPDIKSRYDISSTNGLLVSRVFVGSPAGSAGIKEGDVIRRWNGVSVTGQDHLKYLIQTADTDNRVTITLDRQAKGLLVYCSVAIRPGGV